MAQNGAVAQVRSAAGHVGGGHVGGAVAEQRIAELEAELVSVKATELSQTEAALQVTKLIDQLQQRGPASPAADGEVAAMQREVGQLEGQLSAMKSQHTEAVDVERQLRQELAHAVLNAASSAQV